MIPNLFALLDECQKNPDCPQDKACLSEECVDPCSSTSCGKNAQCRTDFHRAKCSCEQGLQGNPYVACIPVGCRSDSDCRDDESCDRRVQSCQPLCANNPCVPGAQCDARNHKEVCTCIPPLKGDGHVYCKKREIYRKEGFRGLLHKIVSFETYLPIGTFHWE